MSNVPKRVGKKYRPRKMDPVGIRELERQLAPYRAFKRESRKPRQTPKHLWNEIAEEMDKALG